MIQLIVTGQVVEEIVDELSSAIVNALDLLSNNFDLDIGEELFDDFSNPKYENMRFTAGKEDE